MTDNAEIVQLMGGDIILWAISQVDALKINEFLEGLWVEIA